MSAITDAAVRNGPTFAFEDVQDGPVCGIDEVGRGPLAGPVLSACVYIPPDKRSLPFVNDINDSKKLSLKKREAVFNAIEEHCLIGIGKASPEEIDTLNIHHAALLAMKRAYQDYLNHKPPAPSLALIDGKFSPALSCPSQTVIKGDSASVSIAAASIIAKVTRDRIMRRYHEEYPHYGWLTNAGYGSKAHLDSIRSHGITLYHRRSFAPVRDYIEAITD